MNLQSCMCKCGGLCSQMKEFVQVHLVESSGFCKTTARVNDLNSAGDTLFKGLTVCLFCIDWWFYSITYKISQNEIIYKQILIVGSLLGNIFSPMSLIHNSIFIFLHRWCVPALREGLHAFLSLHPTASAGTGAATHHSCSEATSMAPMWVYKWSGTRRHAVPPHEQTPETTLVGLYM